MQKKKCQLVVSFSSPTNCTESPQDESDFQFFLFFCSTHIPNPSSDNKPQAASQLCIQRRQKQTDQIKHGQSGANPKIYIARADSLIRTCRVAFFFFFFFAKYSQTF